MRLGFFGSSDSEPAATGPADASRSVGVRIASEPTTMRDQPPQLPSSLQQELERIVQHRPTPSRDAEPIFGRPQAVAQPPAPAPLVFTGTLDGGALDAIHACRDTIEQVLIAESKEYQILKMLQETDLGVCSDLEADIRQRLHSHALFQIIAKLDEAYRLALRYQVPAGR